MRAREFFRNRSGNVAPMFGLALVLLCTAIGAAVDYSRAGAARTALQSTLDSVALMLSKEAVGLSKSELRARAEAYVAAMFDRPEIKALKIVPSVVSDGNSFKVTIAGSAELDTSFARVFGLKTMEIGTTAQVAWQYRRMELALALDNTGSMASANKMIELKKAVKGLLKTLKETARSTDQIKVAIVPFDTVVNVGTAHKDASWLRFDAGLTKATWTGCITDRDQPYDAQDTAPASLSTQFVAANCKSGGLLEEIRPLSSDWFALEKSVDAMTPSGMTNVSIGLAWAWHALSAGTPLTEAAPAKGDLDKVIVLLTDGKNTENRWSKTASAIDARTKTTCANVKADGIKVYTVRVIEGNAAMLQECASNSSMYFDVSSASQLSAVFATIAKSLANVRIAQ